MISYQIIKIISRRNNIFLILPRFMEPDEDLHVPYMCLPDDAAVAAEKGTFDPPPPKNVFSICET